MIVGAEPLESRMFVLFRWEWGRVTSIIDEDDDSVLMWVAVDGLPRQEKALAYVAITGRPQIGDRVLLNTTAVRLRLGTGGNHFVVSVHEGPDDSRAKCAGSAGAVKPGHIMKLRYTPWQMNVLAGEEPDHPDSSLYRLAETNGLLRTPVVVCELHSQLTPVIWTIRQLAPRPLRIAYVMTDGGALPSWLSRQVKRLKERGWLGTVVTTGHAFGGDVESVNVLSGMLLGKYFGQADIIIVSIGPGIVGTGTKFGHTGLETVHALQAAAQLGGKPIACLRASSGDERERHYGLSHHTLTSLEMCMTPCWAAIPADTPYYSKIQEQLSAYDIPARHAIIEVACRALSDLFSRHEPDATSMGRTVRSDPLFFQSAIAAGVLAFQLAGITE